MNMQAAKIITLLNPVAVGTGGATGSYVDLKGLVNPGGRNMKAVLAVGVSGTASGSIQAADDTAGTGLVTVATFDDQAAGVQEKHFVTNQGYVRVLLAGTASTPMSAFLVGERRFAP